MDELYAGVDLGGTTTWCVLADRDGSIACEQKIATDAHEGPEAVLKRIIDVIKALASETQSQPVALGMGVPGLVDLETGTTKFLPNLPTLWRDIKAGKVLSENLGCPARLLNDVRMATLGELTFGWGRSAPTLVFFAIGTGIGGGVAVDGKLRLGPLGEAGELGHQTVMPDGPLCGCGNRGCMETLAAGPAIAAEGVRLMRTNLAPKLHELVDGDPGRVTAKEMAAAAEAGDEAVRDGIHRAADFLAIGVANMVTALHPDVVVLGGGVAEMGAILFDRVRESVYQRVRMIPADLIRIEHSQLGEQAGLLGAIALASRGHGGESDET